MATQAVFYRALYRRSGNLFILLHMIRKTTGAVPQADIDLARGSSRDTARAMSEENVEIVRKLFEAAARGDAGGSLIEFPPLPSSALTPGKQAE